MKRRTYIHFRNGVLGNGWIKGKHRNSPSVWMGEFLAARDTRTIDAFGGPCPIISIYDVNTHVGAILHLDGGDAEQAGDEHEELIDALIDNVQGVSFKSAVHVFFDPTPYGELLPPAARKEQRAARIAYVDRVIAHLNDKGFTRVKVIRKGQGKTVFLDTRNSRLWSTDDGGAMLVDVHVDT